MEQETIRARVSGQVQGVCFREYTRSKAVALGLCGWVKNCSDGSVEAVFCGPSQRIQEMIAWLHRGSPHSRVDQVLVEPAETQSAPSPFRIVF